MFRLSGINSTFSSLFPFSGLVMQQQQKTPTNVKALGGIFFSGLAFLGLSKQEQNAAILAVRPEQQLPRPLVIPPQLPVTQAQGAVNTHGH